MKPPRCAICGRKFDAFRRGRFAGGLVYFRLGPDQEPLPEGMTGHPPNAAWFCWPHIRPARRLRGLTISQAMRHLRGWRALLPL